MKRKDISLETTFIPRVNALTAESEEYSDTPPGYIADCDGHYGFSRSWKWTEHIEKPENWTEETVPVTLTVTADDSATLTLGEHSITANYDSDAQRPGTQTQTINLLPGYYQATLSFKNIDYTPPSGNVAVLSYSITYAETQTEVPSGEISLTKNDPQPNGSECSCSDTRDAGGVTANSVAAVSAISESASTTSSAGRDTRLNVNENYARWQTSFGSFRGLGGIASGTLEILAYEFSEKTATPEMLEFSHPLNSWLVFPESGIAANAQLKVFTGGSYTSWLCDGSGNTFFALGTSLKTTTTLAWNSDKTEILQTFPDKSVIAFSAETGEITSYKTRNGNTLTKAELDTYLDIVRSTDGVLKQIRNLWDGLMNVENVSDSGYEIALYLPEQVGEKNTSTGLYTVTESAIPFKRFTVSLSETNKLTITEQDSRTGATAFPRSVWFENDAWNSSVGSGENEIITRREVSGAGVVTEVIRNGESVPASSTCEIFATSTSLGKLCTSRTEGYGTNYAETTTYDYDSCGNIVKETRPDGGTFKTTYDAYGRVSARYEPIAGALQKVTYYDYHVSDSNASELSSVKVVLSRTSGPFVLSNTAYTHEETEEYRREERRTTALGSNNTHLEIDETWLGTCTNIYARGRVKMTQNKLGVQTHYEYAAASLSGALYTQTAETRIDGVAVNGKSSREVKFISPDGNTLRTEKYLLDSEGTWRLVASADFEYDSQNRETKRTRGNGRVTQREMMCCGTLWEIDEDGVRTDYTYNGARELTEKMRAATATMPERISLYERDAAGRITREILKLNSVNFSEKTTVWDMLGRIVSETDELGRITTHAYALDASANTRTETVTLPTGGTRITKTYADGSVLSETGTAQRNTKTVFDSVSDGVRTTRRIAGTTADSGILSREIKNGFGEIIRSVRANALDELTYTYNTFNASGQLTRSQTGTLAPTLYAYDAFGNENSRTVALADEPTVLNSRVTETSTQFENHTDGVYRLVSTTTYNASGTALVASSATLVSESATLESKTVSTDVRGNVTTRWTEFGEPGVRVSKTQIPSASNVAQTTVSDGFTVSQIDHAGTQTSFARQFNTGENARIVLTTTDGRGNATTVEQNVLGWTTKTTDAAGNVTTTVYDTAHGKPSCVTDALGKTHCYAYDLHGNAVAEFGTGAQPAVFAFDDADNPVSQKLFRVSSETIETDPRSRTDGDETLWEYHAATGLLLCKIYPDRNTVDYVYDAYDRLTETVYSREVSEGVRLKATRAYAEKTGELLSVSYNDETTVGETHTYNHLGKLTQTVDASGTRVFAYNAYNELESETHTGDGVAHAVTELRDAYGRNTGYTYAKAGTIKQTAGTNYDAETGRIATASFVHGGAEKTFTYGYLADTSLLETLSCPSNLTITHTYEADRDLVTNITIRRGASTNVVLRNYTYDALGRPVTRSTARNGTTQSDTFGYNNRSELTSATLGSNEYGYAFDNIGNRATSSETDTQRTYSSNALNQYQAITETVGGETSYIAPDHDADGNAVLIYTREVGGWVVTYNGANRPVKFENWATETTVECGYDSQGRRYFKKVTVAGEVTLHHRYIYRGYLQIACVDMTRSGHPDLWLTLWDPTQPTATRPLAIQKDGTWFTYGYDITKNVCEVFGPAGYIRTTYSYTPFGAVTESGDVSQPFQWSSEHYDSELGLVYYNYRHYSPTDGRFLSRDPIEEQGGRNLYAFVGNNPTLKYDNLGLLFMWLPVVGTIESLIKTAVSALPGMNFDDYTNPCEGKKGRCMSVAGCEIEISHQWGNFAFDIATPSGGRFVLDMILAALGSILPPLYIVSAIDSLAMIVISGWGVSKLNDASENAKKTFCTPKNCKRR